MTRKYFAALILICSLGLPLWARESQVDVAQEVAKIDMLLTPSSDGLLGDSPLSLQVPKCAAYLQWITRADLLARRRYWQNVSDKKPGIPGRGEIEKYESLAFLDNSMCEYAQTTVGKKGPDRKLVWKRWVDPEKGYDLYKRMALNFPKDNALANPVDNSWCVILVYVSEGQVRIRHFYVSSRLGIHTLVSHAFHISKDPSQRGQNAKHQTTPEWMTERLLYTQTIWNLDKSSRMTPFGH